MAVLSTRSSSSFVSQFPPGKTHSEILILAGIMVASAPEPANNRHSRAGSEACGASVEYMKLAHGVRRRQCTKCTNGGCTSGTLLVGTHTHTHASKRCTDEGRSGPFVHAQVETAAIFAFCPSCCVEERIGLAYNTNDGLDLPL